MKKIFIVYGTRPELIKMAPLVKAVSNSSSLIPVTCSTGQHRELLDQVAKLFGVIPDYSFSLMKENQDLFDITTGALGEMKKVLHEAKPDFVLVQGDTTTAFAAALSAFYMKIPVGHVEAGLRTYDSYSPFPEEMNRSLISKIAELHFAPTRRALDNLIKEGIGSQSVFEVGNTGIDSVFEAKDRSRGLPPSVQVPKGKRLILLTVHRRENFGEPIRRIFSAVKTFLANHPDFHVVYPVHPNPNVKQLAEEWFRDSRNVSLVPALDFHELVAVMKESFFILTDSGGIQEEAPVFGRPVLVLRESTERQEAIDAGCAKLVGSHPSHILKMMERLSDTDSFDYRAMSNAKNPFGNGTAAVQITRILERHLGVAPTLNLIRAA